MPLPPISFSWQGEIFFESKFIDKEWIEFRQDDRVPSVLIFVALQQQENATNYTFPCLYLTAEPQVQERLAQPNKHT